MLKSIFSLRYFSFDNYLYYPTLAISNFIKSLVIKHNITYVTPRISADVFKDCTPSVLSVLIINYSILFPVYRLD